MDKTLGNIFKGDKVIWMVFFFLCIISVIEVYSASAGLTYKGGHYWAPIVKHTGILLVGVFAMVVTLNIKCKYFKIVTPFLLLIAVVALITVLLAGQSTNGAQRWISIVGIQFQPSEIAKGALVLATAQILSALQTEHGADKNAFKYILIVSAFIIPLIMVENLSTAMLLCMVIFMMMIIGRVPGKILGKALGVVTLLILTVFTLVMVVGEDHEKENANPNHIEQVAVAEQKKDPSMFGSVFHRFDTWKGRIDRFIAGKETPPEEFDLDKDAQIGHANIAIVSSNFIGKGPGNSVERDFLSQAFSDFIYAIIIEEMGLFGGFFVAMLYIILLFRTGRIANRCENNFPAFLAMGLALLLVTQALFNMCVAVGLAPVTGQPLPLVSKGGTSTIINCVYIGAILSVSRSAKKKPDADSDEVMAEKLATA
ncbi:cell cycle protein, FtsW/RodA/SpoVE family [Hoylesella buccalis ATCC 35310]|uniref:Probable peptidoglycan glycosyltransferase FtsW n=1 Tax=Hoylesella buccalis ATCC 35310 TaxID=679190 RepID=D1W5E8_9BACT|nr:FtsW/RodA/SpoVE family cell cycle protein [Hoylesella buccalis]EFA92208.1 cell cycle protein, FtsW/RodA/SpoVE family [Hoylesella buccalis ATCC 35310]